MAENQEVRPGTHAKPAGWCSTGPICWTRRGGRLHQGCPPPALDQTVVAISGINAGGTPSWCARLASIWPHPVAPDRFLTSPLRQCRPFEILSPHGASSPRWAARWSTNGGAGLDRTDHRALGRRRRRTSPAWRGGGLPSGAVAEGMARFGWKERPRRCPSCRLPLPGQMGLVNVYEQAFAAHGLHTAQVLLTHEDLADRKRLSSMPAQRCWHCSNTTSFPIINEKTRSPPTIVLATTTRWKRPGRQPG